MKLAIMQPYLFPYIGYYQLINSVDCFIIYDDVNYIKGGWINRNIIQSKGSKHYFTLQVKGASSYKKINETKIGNNSYKILKSISQAYSKAPYYKYVFPIIEQVFQEIDSDITIGDIGTRSIEEVCLYLNIDTKIQRSSVNYGQTQNLKREDRIYEICRLNRAFTYINAIGGEELYNRVSFAERGIKLHFIKSQEIIYKQFSKIFIPDLSIIDVLMFNQKQAISEMLSRYILH